MVNVLKHLDVRFLNLPFAGLAIVQVGIKINLAQQIRTKDLVLVHRLELVRGSRCSHSGFSKTYVRAVQCPVISSKKEQERSSRGARGGGSAPIAL